MSAAAQVSLLRIRDVVARVGLSQPTIYRFIRTGEFPAPIALGANSVAWPSTVIDAWIADKIERATKVAA